MIKREKNDGYHQKVAKTNTRNKFLCTINIIAYKKIQKHQHDWTENSTNCKKLESRSTIINQQGHTKNPIVLKYTHFLFSIQNCSDMSF